MHTCEAPNFLVVTQKYELHVSFKIYMVKFELLMDSNKTIMEVGNIAKATTFESFPHLSYKNTQLLFFVATLFNIFMRQTLNNNLGDDTKIRTARFP